MAKPVDDRPPIIDCFCEPRDQPKPIAFATTVYFGFDSASLSADSMAQLNDLAEKIRPYHIEVIHIVGYADNVGTDAYNRKLSTQRAESVKQYMRSRGVGEARFEVLGKGSASPLSPNAVDDRDDSSNRAKNRRSEIEAHGMTP